MVKNKIMEELSYLKIRVRKNGNLSINDKNGDIGFVSWIELLKMNYLLKNLNH